MKKLLVVVLAGSLACGVLAAWALLRPGPPAASPSAVFTAARTLVVRTGPCTDLWRCPARGMVFPGQTVTLYGSVALSEGAHWGAVTPDLRQWIPLWTGRCAEPVPMGQLGIVCMKLYPDEPFGDLQWLTP